MAAASRRRLIATSVRERSTGREQPLALFSVFHRRCAGLVVILIYYGRLPFHGVMILGGGYGHLEMP